MLQGTRMVLANIAITTFDILIKLHWMLGTSILSYDIVKLQYLT